MMSTALGSRFGSTRDVVTRAATHDHIVQFYESEEFLYGLVVGLLGAGLRAGQPVLAVATRRHGEAVCARLASFGVDVAAARRSGQLTLLDARETLAKVMVDGVPDWEAFRAEIGGPLEQATSGPFAGSVRAYGEMVDLLWQEGNARGALLLEELWARLERTHPFSLLCVYEMGHFSDDPRGGDVEDICAAHDYVVPAESWAGAGDGDARMRQVVRLQLRACALERELERRRELELALRAALDERRRAEEALRGSERDLADFLENAAEGLHWIGPDGTILWANRAELEMLGYARDEYVGHPVAEFHVDREAVDDILARLARNETLRDREARLRCKDGSIRHVLIHSNVLFHDGKFVHTRCFTRDITDRKRLEEQLRRQNEDLGRSVRLTETFVGMLGHDLRNPLNAIATAASLLGRRAETEKISQPATRIARSALRMARMIDQMLDVTRIRLGRGLPLHPRPVDLAEVCRLAVDELEGDAAAPRVRIEAQGDLGGSWDGDRLARLVSNLVSNALVHGCPEGHVVIRLDGTSASEVVLAVSNPGAIPADVLPTLFEPFGAAGGRDPTSGLGLGLHISREVVGAHGGTIDVASSEANGTTFTVRLPRTPPAATAV